MHHWIETTAYHQGDYSVAGAQCSQWLHPHRLVGNQSSALVCLSGFPVSNDVVGHVALGYLSEVAPNSYQLLKLVSHFEISDQTRWIPFIHPYFAISGRISALSFVACRSAFRAWLFSGAFDLLLMTPMTAVKSVSGSLMPLGHTYATALFLGLAVVRVGC